MNYREVFSNVGNFMSFDISVQSTGWCKYKDGVFTYGSFGLESKGDLERRMEFRRKVIELIGNTVYDFVAIEDVILGCNFETTKILIQLNSIIDDLNYLGNIKVNRIERIANTVWKKRLREVSGYDGVYVGDIKKNIRDCLNLLGFCDDVVQDIYDSVGIAVGVIYDRLGVIVNGETSTPKPIKSKRLKTKLNLYDLYEFSFEKLESLKSELNMPVVSMSVHDTRCRDALTLFRQMVEEYGDNNIFVIEAPMSKFGVLALEGKVPLSDDSRVIAVKKGRK